MDGSRASLALSALELTNETAAKHPLSSGYPLLESYLKESGSIEPFSAEGAGATNSISRTINAPVTQLEQMIEHFKAQAQAVTLQASPPHEGR